ncbi:AI-2E family transporter [Brevibacterium sp. 50QC2O2]|uniref:AI-2E family transporter n=1 Tax=Brevibacterium TaxID=1696 RepID=UPI00211CE4E1|nr:MULTISPECIES: AI-2E family transporter [unclassified Brevibacterium]MCQ9384225.1 AI-2E family transporter [Brevibacterium sp. 68QC2CO]MCQ9388296.1 AI-2E family transporter [Brevibacterium sp. 50QC2O2]
MNRTAGSSEQPAVTGTTGGGGLPRFLAVVLALAAFAFSMQFIQGLNSILAPLFLALNLVIVVYPLQRWLVRLRVPAFLAAAVTIVLVLVLIIGFFGLTAWSLAELVLVIPKYSVKIGALYTDALHGLNELGLTPDVLAQQLSGFSVSNLLNTVMSLLSNVSLIATALTTAVMAVFFLGMDSMTLPLRMRLAGRMRPGFTRSLTDFGNGVRRYWIVSTVFGLIVAVLDVIALIIIGVPLAFVWGVLAFLTNYIPNIGFVIGLVPPALMAVVSGDWWDALWVVVSYCVLNFVIQSIIQPKFTGESVGVSPFISFLSLLFWYWVLGWLGALLALPATLLVKALLVDADPASRWVNTFIASSPSTGQPAPEPGEGSKRVPGIAGGRRSRTVVDTTFVNEKE